MSEDADRPAPPAPESPAPAGTEFDVVLDTDGIEVDDEVDTLDISAEASREATDEEAAAKLNGDQFVYVAARLLKEKNAAVAVVRRKVIAVEANGQILVDNGTPQGARVRASKVSDAHKVLLLTVGDLQTEWNLLDPLKGCIGEFLRLLVEPEALIECKVRGLNELQRAWTIYAADVSHVVVIGHGSERGLYFGGDDRDVSAGDFVTCLSGHDTRKTFLLLPCKTGLAGFAKALSAADIAGDVFAPKNSVEAAEGARFVHGFFTDTFLFGVSGAVAFNRAVRAGPAKTARFRMWRKGVMQKVTTG